MSDYISFELSRVPFKGKTNVWDVVGSDGRTILGTVKWYAPWRRYCFIPEPLTVWSADCLASVEEFIEKQMAERKAARA